MASNSGTALWALPLLLVAACEQSVDRTVDIPPPALNLVKTGHGAVELRIAGSYGLRALQGRLVYDPGQVTVTKVEAGEDADRLDRLFFTDPRKAAGSLVIGLSDTRRVLLPARGTLVRFQLKTASPGGKVTLKIEQPLGAIDGGERVEIQPVSAEVGLP